MGEITSLVNSFKPKMVAITESWCRDFIGDAELYLQIYVLYRCDRCNTTGGGILLYMFMILCNLCHVATPLTL